jgi:hypothetical protein
MPVTTPEAIRDRLVELITAIVPTSHVRQRFEVHREELPIRDWAEVNPASCLRRFSVRWLGPVRSPHVSGGDVELVDRDLEVVVTYPTSARHGLKQLADLERVIAEDAAKINQTVGTIGHATRAATTPAVTIRSIEGSEDREDLGPAQAGVVRLNAMYYRSAA